MARHALWVAVLLLAGFSCGPRVVIQGDSGKPDVGVATALQHTMLMAEGCSAVDVGQGLVITAAHCVDQLAPGDDTSVGMLVYRSPVKDFAVLFDTARLGNATPRFRSARLGEHLYAVGYPVQLATERQALTVTDGLYTGAVDELGQERITAPIYFGNSGGGCWAEDGSLVGLTVSGYLEMPGMNFIVPVAAITPWLPR